MAGRTEGKRTSAEAVGSGDLLFVPGVGGSGPDHWQSWMIARLPGSRRLQGVGWEAPILADWALQLRHQVQQHPQPVWLVAHSFGCLVSAVVAADVPERIGGVLLVAPADPARFSVLGRRSDPESPPAITTLLPQQRLGVGGMLISSSNDPWMSADAGQAWAARWQLAWRNIGPVGHINTDSGHGPWPQGLLLLQQLRRGGDGAQTSPPPGPARTAGRGGALARVRLETRRQLGLC